MFKNKKAWIKIVEAVIALLLIIGVILIIMNQGYFNREDIPPNIYKMQNEILREIQTNQEYRKIILDLDKHDLPIEWEDFNETNRLKDIKDYINLRVPGNLKCEAKICLLEERCLLTPEREKEIKKEIYSQATGITATLEKIEYLQLKLFCW